MCYRALKLAPRTELPLVSDLGLRNDLGLCRAILADRCSKNLEVEALHKRFSVPKPAGWRRDRGALELKLPVSGVAWNPSDNGSFSRIRITVEGLRCLSRIQCR
jgi:hypothetical protein